MNFEFSTFGQQISAGSGIEQLGMHGIPGSGLETQRRNELLRGCRHHDADVIAFIA